MSAAKSKIKSSDWFIMIICSLMLAVMVFWYFKINSPSGEVALPGSVGSFQIINHQALTELKVLRLCGQWPFTAVVRSADRGNPFVPKKAGVTEVVTSSTPDCLSLSQ